jgi:protein gp37
MSQNSSIEWTEKTWNPIRGCSPVSPGCAHCYAESIARRFSGEAMPFEDVITDGRWNGRMKLLDHHAGDPLTAPLRWKKPCRVFVNSMSDLFHENLPDEAIDRVFAVMALSPQHTFQILTKRAERMLRWFNETRNGCSRQAFVAKETATIWETLPERERWRRFRNGAHAAGVWPLPNVWLGVSVENQHFADERIPLLLRTPAAVRFISAEPLLGPIDLTGGDDPLKTWLRNGITALRGLLTDEWVPPLDWVIVGGESGPGARLFDYEWARSIIQQCKAATVPVFMKQVGALPIDSSADGLSGSRFLKSKKGNDMSEWPEDLRIREMPTGQR